MWSHCWAFWSHSSLPVPFDTNKVLSYPLYQISLKLSKDAKLLQVLFLKWQWIGDTHGISSAKGKAAAGIKQSPAQLAASTHPGAKQTSFTVHSHAGTVGQCCTEGGRKEVCSRKEKLIQWEGQAVIPLSPVKLINTNLQEDKLHQSSAVYKSRWHIVFSDTFAAGPLASAMPSLLFLQCTYTHFSYPVCLLPNDPILHHPPTSTGPMQWCKTLGYHNDTNSTGFKTREAQPGYLLQGLQPLQNSLLLQHCFTHCQNPLHSLNKASQF